MVSLEGQVVVVTGASDGIGREAVRLFAEHGCRVVLHGRRVDALEESRRLASLNETSSLVVTADLLEHQAVTTVITAAESAFGAIDIWVNNAAIGYRAALDDMTYDEFDRIMTTNARAVLVSFKELVPKMRARRSGRIISVSSMLTTTNGPELTAYAASKAAMEAMCECVAAEVRRDGVQVSIVQPASVDTEFMLKMRELDASEKTAKSRLTSTEVAEQIIWVARQDPNSWVSRVQIRPLGLQ